MAYCSFPDVFQWIHTLPPLSQWTTDSFSMPICSSISSSQPSLTLTISKNPQSLKHCSANLIAHFHIPISLWTSKTINATKLAEDETISKLLVNLIEDVLLYGSDKCSSFIKFVHIDSISKFPDIFNLAFLTLLFLVCIYEAPSDLRSGCLDTIKRHLTNCKSRQASKMLMKMLGSNLEEQWMRSLNLAITNWIAELHAEHKYHGSFKTPSPMFSYAFSTFGLWKVQLYCPVISMDLENSNHDPADDERLQFSLKYHQLEGVFQFNYKVTVKDKWVEIMVNIDNIR